jgi:glycine cleavage system H protein
MTALLVVLTIAIFLVIERFTQRGSRATAPAYSGLAALLRPETISCTEGLFYAPGHTWARVESDGSVRIGIDDLARRLLGRVDRIEAAPPGLKLGRHDAAFVLHQGGKSVCFAMPFNGVVERLNSAVLCTPDHVQTDPEAWLMAVRPHRLSGALRRLRAGDEATHWMRAEVARLRDFLAGLPVADPVGLTLQDGGEPSTGLLERVDAYGWQRFESEFLAS